MKPGFTLTNLTMSGPNVPVAQLAFRPGLNVVVGPSDTGKTFVAQCIDYLLGASTPPKEVPEAAPYDTLCLTIRAREGGTEYKLERSLRGGAISLTTSDGAERVLGDRHIGGEQDTISQFLLTLSGFNGQRIRTNQDGKTREISFRDLSHLVLVNEDTIITETTPICRGQFIHETAERNVFRLVLTGLDDSSVVAQVTAKVLKERREAREETLNELISYTRNQLVLSGLPSSADSLRSQLEATEESIRLVSATLDQDDGEAQALEEKRLRTWEKLRQLESKIRVKVELQTRFILLKEQYLADIQRLDAISETGLRLGELREENCPVCGSPAEHHQAKHPIRGASLENVVRASRAEAESIRILLSDLEATLVATAAQLETLEMERHSAQEALDLTEREVHHHVKPRIQESLQALREHQTRQAELQRALGMYERIRDLEALIKAGRKPAKLKRRKTPVARSPSAALEEFTKEVEGLLRKWAWPNLTRVSFSEEDYDLIISGRRRSSHGKGVRALTHTAFKLALLRYCTQREMPHPGLVIVDSPLVVYRQPEVEEREFPRDVKGSFYRSLATGFSDSQVIILENDGPPAEVSSVANVITFSGRPEGRRGFVP